MWYDDPIQGIESIETAHALQQKIEEKAIPIQLWLEKNIAPLLIQALNALVAKRPSNIKLACEFVSDHLLQHNPLKDTYPEELGPNTKEPEPPCGFTLPPEDFDKTERVDPCGCQSQEPPCKDELGEQAAAGPPSANQMAKKNVIAKDGMWNAEAPDAIGASVLARAKSGRADK
ncbi:uncharacterized protein [Physcomitrium patens]|uniref:Uncharacterized protein n=2 Tax=Physcomitrium patens TaxID=3218 RepID=A0A2K1IJ02_PHYPA|nr:hypothetical protein PHYPA_027949 [Physcomitrium patens]